jgi:hypothetical protein
LYFVEVLRVFPAMRFTFGMRFTIADHLVSSDHLAMRLISVVLSSALIFSPVVARCETGCLVGTVLDNTGQPVKGIRITVGSSTTKWTAGERSCPTLTDESGKFEIDDIPSGQYQSNAFNDAIGYPGIWLPAREVSIAGSGPCTNVTYNVGSRAARLKLAATDTTTSKPVSNLLIHVLPAGQEAYWINVSQYAQAGLVPQVQSLTKLRLEITAKGYSSSVLDFSALMPGETREVALKLAPKGLGCITGAAVDESYSPVKGVSIDPRLLGGGYSADQTPVQTDEKGDFRADTCFPAITIYILKKSPMGSPAIGSVGMGRTACRRCRESK